MDVINALREMGIDTPAIRARAALNPKLAARVADWMKKRLRESKRARINDPAAFALAIFRRPTAYGFMPRPDGEWIQPRRRRR